METITKKQQQELQRRAEAKLRRKKQIRRRRILLAIALMLVAAAAAVITLKVYRDDIRKRIVSADTFREGVVVNGIDLGGLTMAEAKSKLSQIEQEIVDSISLTFVFNGKDYVADSSYFSVSFTTDDVLKQATELARDGSYEELTAEIEDIKLNGREYNFEYSVEPTAEIESYVHSFADSIAVEPTPATFSVRYPEIKVETSAYDTRNLGLIGDAAKEAKLSQEAIDTTDLRDVYFQFTEAVDGYGVETKPLMDAVRQRCADKDFSPIDVQPVPIKSDVTIETLKESLVLRGAASTTYKSKRRNESRCFNLERACGMVYGTVLMPGDTFSANGILGDRTEANGWKLAPAVIEGGAAHEDQAGGGVCQIATTAYMAVLRGDYEVLERRPHSTPSGYPAGLDATINSVTNYIDFKWRNNTEAPVYLFTWIDTVNYSVHCDIFAQPFPDTFDEIELSSTLLETLTPTADEYVSQASFPAPYWMLKNSAVTGYIYESFKTYKLNGEVVETKSIGNSTYNMHPTRYVVWPGYAGEPLYPQYEMKRTEDGKLVLAN